MRKVKIEKANIDADVILYQAGFGAGSKISFGEWDGEGNYYEQSQEKHTTKEDAIELAFTKIENIKKVLGIQDVTLMFSGHLNFRKRLNPLYKANRKNNTPPPFKSEIRDALKERYTFQEVPALEADDLLGINQEANSCLCTIDKDLNQIEGWHYDFYHDKIYWQDKDNAKFLLWKQCLIGDPTDGFYGVKGIGAKTAEKLLVFADDNDWWEIIKNQYISKGYDEKIAIMNARMAEILQPAFYSNNTIYLFNGTDKREALNL